MTAKIKKLNYRVITVGGNTRVWVKPEHKNALLESIDPRALCLDEPMLFVYGPLYPEGTPGPNMNCFTPTTLAPGAVPVLRSWKVRLETTEQSRQLQTKLFDLGGAWVSGYQSILHTEQRLLGCRNGGMLRVHTDEREFNECQAPEVDPDAMIESCPAVWFDYGADLNLGFPLIAPGPSSTEADEPPKDPSGYSLRPWRVQGITPNQSRELQQRVFKYGKTWNTGVSQPQLMEFDSLVFDGRYLSIAVGPPANAKIPLVHAGVMLVSGDSVWLDTGADRLPVIQEKVTKGPVKLRGLDFWHLSGGRQMGRSLLQKHQKETYGTTD